jgi:hypothetical protein
MKRDMMAKFIAERQATYRANRATAGKDGNGDRRLNMWVDTGAALALNRLAHRYGVTKREIIETLLKKEDDRILAELAMDTPEWNIYFRLNVTGQRKNISN